MVVSELCVVMYGEEHLSVFCFFCVMYNISQKISTVILVGTC